MDEHLEPDVLIIGCGIAGAAAALSLAQEGERTICVVTRATAPEETNTWYAQGGIVARGPGDSQEVLEQDILAGGAGASLPRAVQLLAEAGPRLVKDLLIDELGIPFDSGRNGAFSFTQEGGHSVRRVLHIGDSTGRVIEEALVARLRELPNVTLMTGVTAVDLITSPHHVPDPLLAYEPISCLGAYVLEQETTRAITVQAGHTILATGGLGRIYRHTTNPRGARGDGIAMAYRAGARVENAEYVQFHPTTLAAPEGDNFLITEAVRGEGGKLYTPDGRHFMPEYAPKWGDLAPRDVVARAIHQEMVTHDYPFVLLDLTREMDGAEIRRRFPTVYERCQRFGFDFSTEAIPVVPAAHYSCGGVLVDEWGRTTVNRLYAVGEVSCTGVHGANRIASTSLLEGLLWGYRAGEHIRGEKRPERHNDIPDWRASEGPAPDPVLIHQDLRAVQDIMWNYVGLVRSARRLNRALGDLEHLRMSVEDFYRRSLITDGLVGLRNALQTALIVTRAAWTNRGSRGAHFREDAVDIVSPALDDAVQHHVSMGEF